MLGGERLLPPETPSGDIPERQAALFDAPAPVLSPPARSLSRAERIQWRPGQTVALPVHRWLRATSSVTADTEVTGGSPNVLSAL